MSTSHTLAPVNRILRIFLLTNVRCTNHEIVSCHSKLKSVVLVLFLFVVNTILLILKLQTFTSVNHRFQFHNSIETIYWFGYFEYVIDVICLYRTRDSFVKYLQFYKTIDRTLQFSDYAAIRTSLLKTFIGFIASFFILTTFDFYCWFIAYGIKSPLLYSINYFYTFINYLTAIDATSHIIQIEYRLHIIVSSLEKYQDICNVDGSMNDFMHIDVVNAWIRPVALRDTSFDEIAKVHSLCKLYLLLTDQVAYINNAFGVRIITCLLRELILLIHLTNVILRNLLNIDVTTYPSYHLPALTNSFWLLLSGSMQFVTVYRCEQTYRQREKIANVIDHIFIKNRAISHELKSALTELRRLVKARPMTFNAKGFFSLNYPLLASVASIVTTYTIILFESAQ